MTGGQPHRLPPTELAATLHQPVLHRVPAIPRRTVAVAVTGRTVSHHRHLADASGMDPETVG